MPDQPASLNRFSRQIRLHEIGAAGQAKLQNAKVAIVGVGALGCASALLALRAGIRQLRLIDRDFVEEHNLPRQVLFTEAQAREGAPKAVSARTQLMAIDSEAQITALVQDFTPGNAEALLDGCDLVIDGLDNFEARYLINDYCVRAAKPWIYGGAVGSSGMTFPVIPGKSACLRCLFPSPPEAGATDTCETLGVLPTLPTLVATFQVTEAIKILVGDEDAVTRKGLAIELWDNLLRQVPRLQRLPDCPCCGRREFPYLTGEMSGHAETLCGRSAVQIKAPSSMAPLLEIAKRLPPDVITRLNEWLLRFEVDGMQITVFKDGRAIIQGTDDPARARTLYGRFVGT